MKLTCSTASLLLLVSVLFQCSTSNNSYESDQLQITKLTENTFIHTSYLQTEDFGKVSCNGLIYINETEAIVFDTPTTDSASHQLINWIQHSKGVAIKRVIVGHSHEDCLGGLTAFHEAGIPSLANELTIQFVKESGKPLPIESFKEKHITQVGSAHALSIFLGEGHTRDNIVSYISTEKVLFGGCLIKALNANEGYVGEGNVGEWSATVQRVKHKFHDVKYVVPGHGQFGDTTLLDYTMELFSKYKNK